MHDLSSATKYMYHALLDKRVPTKSTAETHTVLIYLGATCLHCLPQSTDKRDSAICSAHKQLCCRGRSSSV